MKTPDVMRFSFRAAAGSPARTLLTLLAMAIGVGAVILLTALAEGARRYVTREFTSLGTHLLIAIPGRSETTGGPPPLLGETPRDLTIEDALALKRSSTIRRIAPVALGSAPVAWRQRERETTVLGSTVDLFDIWQLSMAQGRFLPPGNPSRGSAVCVLGYETKRELFGNASPLGEWVRIGGRRFRVIGVLTPKGQSLGLDMGEIAIIPVASAQMLFNTTSLFRIMVQAGGREAVPPAKRAILNIIRDRHEGEDDVTVITQDAVLRTFDRIFTALTLTVGGIAAISLAVAGILIMNVMMVSVSQRKTEIGLLKAIGSPQRQILDLFLFESAMLSSIGSLMGVVLALVGTWATRRFYPDFPVTIPWWALTAATGVGLLTGLVFGALPARRAAGLEPVEALSRR